MGQVVQVNGDYTIKAKQGSNITFDVGTGPTAGDVIVTGNLTVVGETLLVETTDLSIQDNLITLNKGETGLNGVTKLISGIEIERGALTNTSFVYDEVTDTWQIAEGSTTTGFTNFANSSLRLKNILTDAGEDNGDLTFFNDASNLGVLKVSGATGYNARVTDDNDIPNKRYVDLAIQTNPTFQIRSPGAVTGDTATAIKGDTRIVAFDKDTAYDSALFPIGSYTSNTDLKLDESHIAVFVDSADPILGGAPVAAFYQNKFVVAGLDIFQEGGSLASATVIQVRGSDGNLKLETNDGGRVEITSGLQFNDNQGYTELTGPTALPSQSVVYGGKIGPGNTGLYVSAKNYNSSNIQRSELISKKKALLFGMIF
jgi:hypothetical protein